VFSKAESLSENSYLFEGVSRVLHFIVSEEPAVINREEGTVEGLDSSSCALSAVAAHCGIGARVSCFPFLEGARYP